MSPLEKNDRGPNDQINDNDLAASRRKKDEMAKDLLHKLGYSLDDKEMNLETDRKNLYQVVIEKIMAIPLSTVEGNWAFKLRELEARKNMGEKVTIAVLQKEVEPFAKEMGEIVKTMQAYILEMTKYAEGKKLTAEVLSKMIHGLNTKVSSVADTLLLDKAKYGDLIEAMKWSLGMSKKVDGTEHSVAYSETAAIAALKKHFKDPEVEKFVWTIVTYMDPEEKKIAFLVDYIKEVPDPMKVLEAGNLQGALSSIEMEEILTKSGKSPDPVAKKREEYDAIWNTQQETIVKKTKYMMGKSVGARNAAGDMITIKNTIVFLLKAFAVGTLTANTAVSLFYKGRIKNPAEAVKSAVTNFWSLTAATGLGIAKLATAEETPGEYVTKTDSASKEHAKANVRNVIKGEPGLVPFFDLDNFSGAKAIFDFSQHVKKTVNDDSNPLPAKHLTVDAFTQWLSTQPGYEKLKKSNIPLHDDEKFATIVRSFYVLKIGGVDAEKYKDKIKETA